MEIQKFSPAKAEIQAVVEKFKSLTIKGVEDEQGYLDVKTARKTLGDYRIDITKFGKKQRQEALDYQREVLRQEKELLVMIEPEETRLKTELEKIDEEKKIIARKVLLPARAKMLEEIEIKLLDAEILRMDEKEFSAYYSESKMAYLEEKERQRIAKEQAKAREKEIEEAKKKAVAEAKEQAEREKQQAIERLKQEQADKERKAQEEKVRAEEKAREEQEKAEKNRKYKKWLKDNNYNDQDFKVEREGSTFTLYKKISVLTIK